MKLSRFLDQDYCGDSNYSDCLVMATSLGSDLAEDIPADPKDLAIVADTAVLEEYIKKDKYKIRHRSVEDTELTNTITNLRSSLDTHKTIITLVW